ncbi:MAG TPA: hypothetical protein VM843_01445 [Flavisolibacter sp.]|jgi:hypothetical protein|nr:hypothetical protein [Flavisolibacter sp.]
MRLLVSLTFCLLLTSLSSCTNSSSKGNKPGHFDDAVSYNDYIIQRQGKIINHILAVASQVGTDLDSAEALLGKGVLITDSALAQVGAMAPYQGDTTFRNRALGNFHFYRRLFTSDYRKIIAINRKGETATEADIEAIQSIQENLEAEEAELDKLLSNAQSDFAKRNKMPLLENDVQKKIDSVQ